MEATLLYLYPAHKQTEVKNNNKIKIKAQHKNTEH